jgi:hypothetical protein
MGKQHECFEEQIVKSFSPGEHACVIPINLSLHHIGEKCKLNVNKHNYFLINFTL